jgi:hypothetical protein
MEEIITKTNIICDECGKRVSKKKDWNTPYRWFRIEKLKLLYRKSNSEEYIPRENGMNIDESIDPHFCCKACAIKWFEKQLNKISK